MIIIESRKIHFDNLLFIALFEGCGLIVILIHSYICMVKISLTSSSFLESPSHEKNGVILVQTDAQILPNIVLIRYHPPKFAGS